MALVLPRLHILACTSVFFQKTSLLSIKLFATLSFFCFKKCPCHSTKSLSLIHPVLYRHNLELEFRFPLLMSADILPGEWGLLLPTFLLCLPPLTLIGILSQGARPVCHGSFPPTALPHEGVSTQEHHEPACASGKGQEQGAFRKPF